MEGEYGGFANFEVCKLHGFANFLVLRTSSRLVSQSVLRLYREHFGFANRLVPRTFGDAKSNMNCDTDFAALFISH